MSPENLGKVDQLLQIFVSRGCSQKAYSDLNNELRMAYGRDLAGTVDEVQKAHNRDGLLGSN